MIKFIKTSLLCLVLFAGCESATLMDESVNKFLINTTKGDFSTKVDVSWVNMDYYSSYEILRSDTEDGLYEPVSGKISTDIYSDTDITSGAMYYYKVRGYNNVNFPIYVSDAASGYAGAEGGFYPPDTVEATSKTKSITISWNRVKGADTYGVMKSSEKDSGYVEISRTSQLEHPDYDVSSGQVYYYRIISYDEEGSPSANSSTSISASVFNAELYLTTGLDSDVISLQWQTYDLATSYMIYRAENDQYATSELIATVNAVNADTMEYIDKDVKVGDLYYYYIIYKNATGAAKTETVRGYLYQDGASSKPVITDVSRGTYTDDIVVKWDAIDDVEYYEVSRSTSEKGPWTMLDTTTSTTYMDRGVPDGVSTYFYTVTAFNPIPSVESDSVIGWVNRPPQNINATQNLSSRVWVSWDPVPGVELYLITYSVDNTTFLPVDGSAVTNNNRVYFDHVYDIGVDESKEIYYKVQVKANGDFSAPSDSVIGKIQKMTAPQNLRVSGNKTKTKTMRLLWDAVPGANKYYIYRAVLKHMNTDPDSITPEDYSYLGEADNTAFDLSFTYPIRRSKYYVQAVDVDDVTGAATETETVWRLPVDTTDFVKDVDFTINQAQRQIADFGAMSSSGNIKDRRNMGTYVYKSTPATNSWEDYASFEVELSGAQSLSVQITSLSAKMNGFLYVNGLYKGSIEYKDLNSKEGGYAIGGGLQINYDDVSEYWDYQTAANEMEALRISGDSTPRDPNNPNSSYYAEIGVGENYK